MNITQEIEGSPDVAALRWLFARYHMSSQWQFVARCEHRRYGTQSYEIRRVWHPTQEGLTLYRHREELKP